MAGFSPYLTYCYIQLYSPALKQSPKKRTSAFFSVPYYRKKPVPQTMTLPRMPHENSDTPAVSAELPDWEREKPRRFWDPSRRLLKSLREYQSAKKRSGVWATISRKIHNLQHRFWSVVTQADIPINCSLAGGLILPHPNGIVIHSKSSVGPNCIIFQQVTLGTSSAGSGLPKLGGGVEIGAGAKILGPVTIGDHAIVGANAVVVDDIPEAAIAVGIPARIVGYRWDTDKG